MKKLLVATLLFNAVTASAVQFIAGGKKKQSFYWLTGTWQMNNPGAVISEKWDPLDDRTMTGESTMTRNTGETILLEKIQLAFRGKDYYYIPAAQGQNNGQPVPFRITSFSENGFVAGNPEHDFPKRITNNAVNRDSIHANIDGGPLQPGKRSDFYYSRVKK